MFLILYVALLKALLVLIDQNYNDNVTSPVKSTYYSTTALLILLLLGPHTFDSIYDLLSSAEISTMRMAVQSGDAKAVDDLMERLNDTLAVEELTTTYGGGLWSREADRYDLSKGTSPILHAARSGNLAVFESVMKAMQAKLSREQVTSHTIMLSFDYLESTRLPAVNVHGP